MSDGWGTRDMKARCHELREDLVALEAPVTAQELADYWPGGAENKLTGRGAWIYCWAQYSAFLRRREHLDDPDTQEEAHDIALKAFRDDPVAVELVRPLPSGESFLTVHPKSPATLSLLDGIEAESSWLFERIEYLEKRWEGEAAQKLAEFRRAQTTNDLYAVWVCTHEGASSPFNPDETWPPLPDWLRHLEALDLINIVRAHHAVNRKRIELVAAVLQKRSGGSEGRFSWATLKVRAADSLRQPLDHLEKVRSLASWFAQAVILWEDQAESAERSQQRARRPAASLEEVMG